MQRACSSVLAIYLYAVFGLSSCASPRRAIPEEVGLSSEKLKAVHSLLEESTRKDVVAGAVALVARHGEIAFLEAVGSQDRAANVPMSPDSIFRVCSMTKPVTSVAAMILVEEGKLRLEDPVSKYIPEFKEAKVAKPAAPAAAVAPETYTLVPAGREVTLFHLLTHTSGLIYTFGGLEPLSSLYRKAGVSDGLVETDSTNEDNARRLAAQPLLFQPGSSWGYGLSTDVLGRVVEVASGMTLEEFFEARIFGPLGMKDTHFRVPPEKLPRLATVYRPAADDKLERQPDGPLPLGASQYSSTYPYTGPGKLFSGGAGLVSTVPDYFRFCLMLRNHGELNGVRILEKETVAKMTSDQIRPLEPIFKSHGDGFGLGFGVVTEAGKDAGYGSPGTFSWGGFYYTYFWVDPKKDLIGIVMSQLYPWGKRTLWDDFRRSVYAACLD